MERSAYQNLRFQVESEIVNFDECNSDRDALLNSVMRLFIQAMAAEQVKRQISKRQLLTFRRDIQVSLPNWALTNPALSSRLPTL